MQYQAVTISLDEKQKKLIIHAMSIHNIPNVGEFHVSNSLLVITLLTTHTNVHLSINHFLIHTCHPYTNSQLRRASYQIT